MSTNTQYAVGPFGGYDFSGVPAGDYYWCVWVDPNAALTETDEWDNKVVTWDASVTVRP